MPVLNKLREIYERRRKHVTKEHMEDYVCEQSVLDKVTGCMMSTVTRDYYSIGTNRPCLLFP
jgi:hypothetical protein